jgi:hypothetical protein
MSDIADKLWSRHEDIDGIPANIVDGLFAIAHALDKVAIAIEHYRTDHPLQGETFDGIQSAIEQVATAIEEHSKEDGIQNAIEQVATAIEEHGKEAE